MISHFSLKSEVFRVCKRSCHFQNQLAFLPLLPRKRCNKTSKQYANYSSILLRDHITHRQSGWKNIAVNINTASCNANCFLSYKDAHGCGDFKGSSELVHLSECNSDISAHLKRCHLSKDSITEKELILMRASIQSIKAIVQIKEIDNIIYRCGL